MQLFYGQRTRPKCWRSMNRWCIFSSLLNWRYLPWHGHIPRMIALYSFSYRKCGNWWLILGCKCHNMRHGWRPQSTIWYCIFFGWSMVLFFLRAAIVSATKYLIYAAYIIFMGHQWLDFILLETFTSSVSPREHFEGGNCAKIL